MNIILYAISILTFLFQFVKGDPLWTLLNDDLQPTVSNQKIIVNHTYTEYQSIYNVTTTNVQYKEYKIIIDLQIIDYQKKHQITKEELISNLQTHQHYNSRDCSIFANDFICVLRNTSTQQNFIEIIIQLGFQYRIKNLQIFILKCQKNCVLFDYAEGLCILCENQYELKNQNSCVKIGDNHYEQYQPFKYLGIQYYDQLQFKMKQKLFEIPNGYVDTVILDYNTSNITREIIINENIYTGPFIQNEGVTYSNLNLKFNDQIDIRIEFLVFVLNQEFSYNYLYFSINEFVAFSIIDSNLLNKKENCLSASYESCKVLKFERFFQNVTQIDSFKIQGNFKLNQKNLAWAFGDFKIIQFQQQKCNQMIYQSRCLKQCPLGTKADNNVCLDIIKDKFIILHYILYFNNFEFQNNNRFYFNESVFYKYENNTYQLIHKKIDLQIKQQKNFRLSFKLIIVDASINEQIQINLANYTLYFNISDFEPLKTQIGDENLQDYKFEIQNKNFELANDIGYSKLQIIRTSCKFKNCDVFISQLLLISPKCNHNCEKCNPSSGCIEPIKQGQNCPDGQYYSNFNCNNCQVSCSKCENLYNCIECQDGHTKISGFCYSNKKNKQLMTIPLKMCRNEPISTLDCVDSNCDEQFQVRNVEFCICQDGYIFNQDYQCIPCLSSCLTCVISTDQCTSCKISEYRQLQSGYCICQDGYFEDQGSKLCQQCLPKCKQCQYKQFICTECYLSQHKVLQSNDCVCQEGYFLDFIHDICLQCNKSCKTCKDFNTCTSCDELQYRVQTFQDQCVCQKGYFLNNEICIPCHYTCYECKDSSEFNKCIKCPKDRKRKNISIDYFECVCNEGYYDNGEQQCQNCQQLNDPPIDHYCYAKCGDGIIQWNEECDNGVSNLYDGCQQCILTNSKCQIDICQICYLKECQQCHDGYYLRNDYTCHQCSPICKTCKNNPKNCIICAENNHQCSNCLPQNGFYYDYNSCKSICGDGFITQDEQCDDGNLVDNDGCNSYCQIEHNFVCGSICINKPIMHFQIEQNQIDKYYTNQRNFQITLQNYEYNIEIEQLQLYYQIKEDITNNCGQLNYTINKSQLSKLSSQKFLVKLFLNQTCIDQKLNFLLVKDRIIIQEKQIQIRNYLKIKYLLSSILDYIIILFDLLLKVYQIIFIINFIFTNSDKYFEILFLFQLISFQNHFQILNPKHFEAFLKLFTPYQMIAMQQNNLIDNEEHQYESYQAQMKDLFPNIFKQHLYIIILIIINSSIHTIIQFLFRTNKIQTRYNQEDLIKNFKKFIIYQLIYFINYFNQSLFLFITQNSNTLQILLYVAFYSICHSNTYAYFQKKVSVMRFVVLLNSFYIITIMMNTNIKIYSILLNSLIIAVMLTLCSIEKTQFYLKYKLLLANLWATHFLFLIFQLYPSTIQKYEEYNQLLGGIMIINYFIILLFQLLEILKNSIKFITNIYLKLKQRGIMISNRSIFSAQVFYYILTQRISN